jgi:hypothetical protein
MLSCMLVYLFHAPAILLCLLNVRHQQGMKFFTGCWSAQWCEFMHQNFDKNIHFFYGSVVNVGNVSEVLFVVRLIQW